MFKVLFKVPPDFLRISCEVTQPDCVSLFMSRKLRYIPHGGALVEITCRCFQGRYLLRPSPAVNNLVAGVLGRAQRLYPVEIHGYAFMSNHYHLLITVPDARRMAQFVGYFNSNLARELGKMHDWSDKFFSRRYQAIVVSNEEAAQESRLKYLLSQSVKEGLVSHPSDWPGLHCAKELLSRKNSITGKWRDRTRQSLHYKLTRQTKAFMRTERIHLTALPCWQEKSLKWISERTQELISLVEGTNDRHHWRQLPEPAPTERPTRLKKSPAPLFHCASKRVRKLLYEGYCWFVAAYRDACEQLKAGNLAAAFPAGSFPPPRPFVVLDN